MSATAEAKVPFRSSLATSPGCVALPTSEIGRFLLFTISLAATIQPHGSRLAAAASASVTENLNAIIREQMGPQDKWLWVMGDDHVWPADTLMVLLHTLDEHPEIDMLVPLCAKRNPPWVPVLYDRLAGQTDENGIQLLKQWDWPDLTRVVNEQGDVFPVDAAGSAGMLIRRHVLDRLGDPWFSSTPDTAGRQVVLNEDLTFCLRAKDEGFTLAATTRATLGHLGIFNVRPVKKGGRYGALTEFSSANEQLRHLFMPLTEEQLA